jgi:DNA-binding XRE family transcriptional regulator
MGNRTTGLAQRFIFTQLTMYAVWRTVGDMRATQPEQDVGLRIDFRRLRATRRFLDVTQQELGALLGVRPSAISNWEHNKRLPGFAFVVRLARALGTPITDLFEVTDGEGNAVDLRRRRHRE